MFEMTFGPLTLPYQLTKNFDLMKMFVLLDEYSENHTTTVWRNYLVL